MNNTDYASDESGFLRDEDIICGISRNLSDVTIIRESGINVLAQASRYGRLWMLKGLKKEYAGSTIQRQRLYKEFEIHSRLQHPGIVAATSFEEADSIGECIVMEWVEGITLEEALGNGSLSKDDRKRLLLEILDAVEYIHSQGIVHRDLKPSNIMVRRNGGRAVVIDFGLADTDSYLLLKQPAGTAGYISEKQASVADADAANDVFSLGVIIRQMCPEYSKISSLCTSKNGPKFANAGELLNAVKRHDRNRRLFRRFLTAAVIGILAILAALDIVSLRNSANESDLKVASLTDSISALRTRLAEDDQRIRDFEQHEQLINSTLAAGRQSVDSILNDFSKRRMAKINAYDPMALANAISEVTTVLRNHARNFVSSLPDNISDEDRIMIETNINAYIGTAYDKWIRKTSPLFQGI